MKLNRLLLLSAAVLVVVPATRAENLSGLFTNPPADSPPAAPRPTSILFIQCDGLGCGDLSCYGPSKFQTPNLDRLAARGIRFTNYAAGAAAGSADGAALLLGRNPGPDQTNLVLSADDVTVAELLQKSGYHTGYIGEWRLGDEHSGGAPWRQGFDEFTGYFNPADAGNFYADYVYRYDRHGSRYSTNSAMPGFNGRELLYDNSIGKRSHYIPDLYAKAAANFIRNSAPDPLGGYRPFFLLLRFKIPDRPFEVPTDAPYSDEPWSQAEKNRAALIARIDGSLGQLQEQLRKSDMTNNFVIFFSSAGPTRPAGAADPHSSGRVTAPGDSLAPMIACWPGTIPEGQVSGFKWSPSDFLATAAEIARATAPANPAGKSVLRVLRGRGQPDDPGAN